MRSKLLDSTWNAQSKTAKKDFCPKIYLLEILDFERESYLHNLKLFLRKVVKKEENFISEIYYVFFLNVLPKIIKNEIFT